MPGQNVWGECDPFVLGGELIDGKKEKGDGA